MEEILDQIFYGSMLKNWNLVDSLIDDIEESSNISNIKNYKVFLHSKNKTDIKQVHKNIEISFNNYEHANKLRIFIEAYPYTGECTGINLETNIQKINTFLECVEDPILIELFLTRKKKSIKEISIHYKKASLLLEKRGFKKLSNQAFGWHLKCKSEESKNVKKSASYDMKAGECFRKSGEKELYHDASGLANIELMSSTTDLKEQIEYSRKASFHFKKSGNLEVFKMKDLRRHNAIRLFKFAEMQDSLLESAKYYKEAAYEFKVGGDEIFYHKTMALFYKCVLFDAGNFNEKAKIFGKIAFHCKKGNDEIKYYRALGDKYNSLAWGTYGNLKKTAVHFKKASINYLKAGDKLNSHIASGSFYQTKALIADDRKSSRDFFFKAAEEFKKGKALLNYHNAIGYAKIFNIPDSSKAKPDLWKEISDDFKKGNTIDMQLLSMHNYYRSKLFLTDDPDKRVICRKKMISALKGFIDYLENKTPHNIDEFLLSKTGIDSSNLLALYKGIYYRIVAKSEKELEKQNEYYQKAIECFKSTLKEHPNVVAFRDLGWIFFEINNFDQSLEAFKEAEKLAPDDGSIKIEIEIAEKALIKDYVKTKEDYEKEKEARINSEEDLIKYIDILRTHSPSRHKDSFMDRILRVLFDAGRNFEKRPETFAKFSEPELRDILLPILNNEFKDEASGETIQGKGKIDIHIKNPNDHREIVIIECKKWNGKKNHFEGLKQMMGYLTGREKKSILLTFSNNIHFSDISDQAKEAIKKHNNYIENSIEDLESLSDIHESNFISKHKLSRSTKIKVYHLFFNLGFLSK